MILNRYNKAKIDHQKTLAIKNDTTDIHTRFQAALEEHEMKLVQELRRYVQSQRFAWRRVHDMGKTIDWSNNTDLAYHADLGYFIRDGVWCAAQPINGGYTAVNTHNGQLVQTNLERIQLATDDEVLHTYHLLKVNNKEFGDPKRSFQLDRFINADAALQYLTIIRDENDI